MAGEWIDTTVGEIAPFSYGKGLPERERKQTGSVPVYGSNGIVGFHDSALTGGPTIVIGRKGTVGAVHYSPIPCWPIDTTFFVSDSDRSLVRYSYYLLKSLGLENMNADSAVPGLNRDAAHARIVLIPRDKAEQRAIAHILGTLDDKIELNRKQSETLEAMARALFKAWFVDFEPVRAKMEGRWQRGQSLPGLPAHLYDLFPDRLVDSELGEIPEGWRVFAFGDVAQQGKGVVNPGNSPQDLFTHYSLPAFDSAHCPSIEPGHAIKSNKTPVPDGAVLVSKLNPHIPRVWHVGTAGPNAVCSTEFIVWAPKAPANSAFLYCLASSPEFSGAMHQLVTGTSNSHQRVKPDQLREIRVFAATENAIEAFSEWVRSPLEKILQNRQQSRTLAQLRDALLPRLISGELRIADAEKPMEKFSQ
ncbi:restriction modification system DNA specificity domain [Deinococcus geothermalis DSM 11300]|uniref:Restriction modification system DNA specificity domain n=1 Tax=Deinococcus geothermalis (strain DSM 11300 / CIP 105573 / AG-3a) TaxID=319795 RepID=Q1IWS4_DEIGD|nr:restriction endonuclease subunit S [Deinococcus geothermalis]ABF46310.1 restriction modification system DNA specificity domain [Deinococcus geothermalis DSM 11300]